MPNVCEILTSGLPNIVIACSSLATAIAAWIALSTWKKAQESKNKYDIAKQCMREAIILHKGIIIDRFKLSNTEIDSWPKIFPEAQMAGDNFLTTAIEAQLHFGEEEFGPIAKKISDIAQEFQICADIYPLYKSQKSLDNANSNKLIPITQLNKLKPTAVEIFESDDPMDNNDRYKKKIDEAFRALEEFLSQYIKKA